MAGRVDMSGRSLRNGVGELFVLLLYGSERDDAIDDTLLKPDAAWVDFMVKASWHL
jgi:hypothetical protein